MDELNIKNINLNCDSDIAAEDEERLLTSPPSNVYEEAMEASNEGLPAETEAPLDSNPQPQAGTSGTNQQVLSPGGSAENDPNGVLQRYRKLNGAGKKRFAWFLRHGRTREEAVIEALKPISREVGKHPPTPGKRRRTSEEATPESQKGSVKKKRVSFRDRPPTAAGSYKDAVVGRKVGILDANFPETLLVFGQMLKIQESILQAIVDQEGKGPKPVFLDSNYRRGWLSITCGNDDTLEWLKRHLASAKPCEEVSLRLVEGDQLPHPQIATGYFPNSADDAEDRIFALLTGQNEGLHVEHWRVLHRRKEGNMAVLTLSVDVASAASLQKKKKVNFKFGRATIQLKSGGRKKAGSASEGEGDSEMEVGGEETSGVAPEPTQTAPQGPDPTPGPSTSEQRPTRPYPLPAGHPSGTSRCSEPSGPPTQQRPLDSRGGARGGKRSMKQFRPQLHGSNKRKPGRPPEEWQRKKKGGRGRK